MSYEVKYNYIDMNFLVGIGQSLGVYKTGMSKYNLINDIKKQVDKLNSDAIYRLFLEWTPNRYLYTAPYNSFEVKEMVVDLLISNGAIRNEILISDDDYSWAQSQGLLEVVEYWNDNFNCDDYEKMVPQYYCNTYYSIDGLLGNKQIHIEVIRHPRQRDSSLILMRISGTPPFSSCASTLTDYFSVNGFKLEDNRPPCIFEFTKSRNENIYFTVDPNNKNNKLPYLDIGEFISEILDTASLSENINDNKKRALYIFQIHSLLDHVTTLFLQNIGYKNTNLNGTLASELKEVEGMLGNKISILHNKLGVINFWERAAIFKANNVRNEFYHANNAFQTKFIDYNKWHNSYKNLMLVPIPRPTDYMIFFDGVKILLNALGISNNICNSKIERIYINTGKITDDTNSGINEEYFGHELINKFLIRNLLMYFNSDRQNEICKNCGMRMVGIEVKRCIFCCPKCGKNDAILSRKYTCGHGEHPIFGLYRHIIHESLDIANEHISKGNNFNALLMLKLCFDATISCGLLDGKNYFDEIEKIRNFGIVLTPDYKEITRKYPNFFNADRGKAFNIIVSMSKKNHLNQLKEKPPKKEDLKGIINLIEYSKLLIGFNDLPNY